MIYFILIKKKKWNPFFNFEIINYYYESIGEGGCNFQSPKTNLITFTHYVTDPEFSLFTMNGCTHNEAFCVNRILVLKFTPDPKWNTYDPLLKMPKKWLAPYTTSKSTRDSWQKLCQAKNEILLPFLDWNFPALTEFKSIYGALWAITIFAGLLDADFFSKNMHQKITL